ncbi:DUF4392 domain-containing protein [Marinomonas sp. GJ51-6]|uniref:DUF4392 domain-containing protein n=1 Tax=Marinomonas sp. GJ51-6 TaxID=2992802 RepID=UPI0029351380|nr:glutamate cyclase domain-containing protein [Marinomonas sp. GJ51-6]WOD07720.1 DUF4392 domain-containing protein [Marinomonas sp. GJ51-6]
MSNSLETISINIEEALVARNLRGMADVRPALQEGYCLRAAQTLFDAKGVVLIGTGFPVTDTFETDGPLGAIALYKTLEKIGSTPYIVCGAPLSQALKNDYRVIDIQLGKHDKQDQEAQAVLDELQPKVVFSIERPGQTEDGHYYNMRGENISARSACFDSFMNQATCPTIAIGDGGNEIGMGNITEALKSLDIVAATTKCDELLVADVSNWGAYGLIAMIGRLANTDLLADINPLEILRYLSSLGSVDGVTRLNQLTEDGQDVEVGDALILELRRLSGF